MTVPGPRLSVSGLLRGQDLSGTAVVTLDEDAVRIESTAGAFRVPLAQLDGVRYAVDTLELFVTRGDVVVLTGSAALAALAAQIERQVMTVPELTRSLRGLGSGRAAPGAEHDRFFSVLLTARRDAQTAATPDRARAAFDAAGLRAAVLQRLHEMAERHHPDEPPERRALDAELLEVSEPLLARLDRLGVAQDALASSDDAERLAQWRDWSAALHDAFESGDEVWLALMPVLAADPPARAARRHLKAKRVRKEP